MNEMINEKGSGAELNIQELLEAYLRRWKLIVVCMVVAAMATLAVSVFCITPMYRAGIKVYVNNRTVTEDKDTTSSGDLSASIYLVKGYELVTKSDSVLQVVADKLENDYTIAQLKSAMYEAGAIYASMSGSGSAMYGLYDHRPTYEPLYAEEQVFVAQL